MSQVKLLDCTLRDGGYYTNWEFDQHLVREYLQAMEEMKVEKVEIGFRSSTTAVGPYGRSDEAFIREMAGSYPGEIGVMVNARDAITFPSGIDGFVKAHFVDFDRSRLSFVRVATHLADVWETRQLCGLLVDLGYEVALNVMQADGLGDSAEALARQIEGYGCVHLLYFADSLGCMAPEDVGDLIAAAGRGWSGELGFHAHDNMQEAEWNCRAAISAGARWVDGTVCGMGRGAGNASTLALAFVIGKSTHPVRELGLKYFLPMQKGYGWGYNDFYMEAADKRVHPTYVQEMLKHGVDSARIYEVIDTLHQQGGRQFSQEKLMALLQGRVGV